MKSLLLSICALLLVVFVQVNAVAQTVKVNGWIITTSSTSVSTNLLSRRIEVAKTTEVATGHKAAALACSKKGAYWRLPSRRELILIWIVKDELPSAPDKVDHWTANTRYGQYGSTAFYINMGTGSMGDSEILSNNPKAYRCIKRG